jgi:hypothetical protein
VRETSISIPPSATKDLDPTSSAWQSSDQRHAPKKARPFAIAGIVVAVFALLGSAGAALYWGFPRTTGERARQSGMATSPGSAPAIIAEEATPRSSAPTRDVAADESGSAAPSLASTAEPALPRDPRTQPSPRPAPPFTSARTPVAITTGGPSVSPSPSTQPSAANQVNAPSAKPYDIESATATRH